ncbi:MAG: HEPN domain-containing protein [Euryarchaeota archaeon]|nr:HEPN domain-containing protein [Euryarchaeota archaeon]MBU4129098.1 HEPN domain-containing protein [bacterium]
MKEQVVKEWIERGKHDLEVAKILLAEEEYSDVVLFHIHQAVEKYLKGFLIYKGWGLKKIHDIELLITEAMSFDDEFQKYLDLGRELTAFYYEERYPPGPITSYSKEEIEEILGVAEEIINKLKEGIK